MLDSSAWIDYFTGTKRGEEIRKQLRDARCFSSTFAITEVCAWARSRGEDEEVFFRILLKKSLLVHLDAEVGINAARLYSLAHKKRPKFSYADAVALASADHINATLVTCDNDFTGMKNVLVVR